MNTKVDFYFVKAKKWKEELEMLRVISNQSDLNEELKWGSPCYTVNKKNVFLIHVFKDYCALLFMKGALFNDEAGLLIQQTENVQLARQLRFTSVQEIVKKKNAINSFIKQAIEVEKSGRKFEFKKTREFNVPEEWQQAIHKNVKLKKAFESLTPGRQRAYLLFFSSAKQSKTRIERIEKHKHKILEGKGIDDDYKKN